MASVHFLKNMDRWGASSSLPGLVLSAAAGCDLVPAESRFLPCDGRKMA